MRNWTPEQQQAINARGASFLVSAAAGSGKTQHCGVNPCPLA